MAWQRELLDHLENAGPCGYFARAEAASEPTALAGLALAAADRHEAARAHGDWLLAQQRDVGTVGVTSSRDSPCWPTSLAMILWYELDDEGRYGTAIERATSWALAERGLTMPRQPTFGHDTTLTGWSWAAHTHSWQEPTAMFVLALKAVGQSQHPRTREAVQLLVDRLLPTGGCNYGNTLVFDQELLPHIEPTGLTLLALADEEVADERIEHSLNYLNSELTPDTATASLCYGLMGLAAQQRAPATQSAWLEPVYRRTQERGASPFKMALIALAASNQNPLQPNTESARKDAKEQRTQSRKS